MYINIIKPFFDRIFAALALVVTLPVFILVILALAIANKGAVWFTQDRPGKKGRIFRVIKFKTMTDAMDATGALLPDKDRLTGVGRLIRKTSLDELPQLFNVLKGEMSFVGPRPLLVEYLPLYNERQQTRHDVRPGITGWAQVNGLRGETETLEKMKARIDYDIDYLRNWSPKLDMYIVIKTVLLVFKGQKEAY